MSYVQTATSLTAAISALVGQAFRKAAVRVSAAWTAIVNRYNVKALDELDDYQLADIGLTRDDLREAFRTPLLTDPTLKLASASGGRASLIAMDVAGGRPRRHP